jgi:hypothetical protein
MIDTFPTIRYCSWVDWTQKTVSTVGLPSIWVVFGVRISVEVRRTGKNGLDCAERNSRWICDRTRGILVVLSIDASWKTGLFLEWVDISTTVRGAYQLRFHPLLWHFPMLISNEEQMPLVSRKERNVGEV